MTLVGKGRGAGSGGSRGTFKGGGGGGGGSPGGSDGGDTEHGGPGCGVEQLHVAYEESEAHRRERHRALQGLLAYAEEG